MRTKIYAVLNVYGKGEVGRKWIGTANVPDDGRISVRKWRELDQAARAAFNRKTGRTVTIIDELGRVLEIHAGASVAVFKERKGVK